MSDGGAATPVPNPTNHNSNTNPFPIPQKQENPSQHFTRNPTQKDDFTLTLAKISVSQILENEGFQGMQQSALDALSDVAIRYIKEIGKVSGLYANLSGRNECNVFDVIQGLEDLGSVSGFSGGSDVYHSVSESGVVREIEQFVGFREKVPFAFRVPRFPFRSVPTLPLSFSQSGQVPPGPHVPRWLPAFPESDDDEGDVAVVEKERQLVGRVESGVGMEVNPYLVEPYRYGEKDVGLVEPRARFMGEYHRNVMEKCEPVSASEEAEEEPGGWYEVGERSKVGREDWTPTVLFKLSNVKKLMKDLVGEMDGGDEKDAMVIRVEKEEMHGKEGNVFRMDDEMDEKDEKDGDVFRMEEKEMDGKDGDVVRMEEEEMDGNGEDVVRTEEQMDGNSGDVVRMEMDEKDGNVVRMEEETDGKDGDVVQTEEEMDGKNGDVVWTEEEMDEKDGDVVRKEEEMDGKDGDVDRKEEEMGGKDGDVVRKEEEMGGKDGDVVRTEEEMDAKDGDVFRTDEEMDGKDGDVVRTGEGMDGKNGDVDVVRMDAEIDEKKRRAEEIVKESMVTTQELDSTE